jgi:hypothetical protein
MRLALALLACALLGGCDHLYGGFDGGGRHNRTLEPVRHGEHGGAASVSPVQD